MQNDFGVEQGRISDFGGDGSLRPKPWSRPRFSKPFAHFSALKRVVTHCGETVFAPKSDVLGR